MRRLTLEEACTIVDSAITKAGELGLRPVTVAVLDDGGHLKMFKRQDGPGAALRPHSVRMAQVLRFAPTSP
jgi:uncharacterized protein GlcG (DUF336 family)